MKVKYQFPWKKQKQKDTLHALDVIQLSKKEDFMTQTEMVG
jgi:hypothetical protein